MVRTHVRLVYMQECVRTFVPDTGFQIRACIAILVYTVASMTGQPPPIYVCALPQLIFSPSNLYRHIS